MTRRLTRNRLERLDAAIRDGSTLRATITTGTVRAATDDDRREVSGIGVPYGEVIEHWFGRESFAPGSVESAGARLLWQHRDPIGVITTGKDSDAGHEITGRVSRTALGDDALVLVRDEVINAFSIGFEPIEYRVEIDAATDEESIVWTKVRAREFSLVTFPAYETAAITKTRSRTAGPTNGRNSMDPDETGGVDTLTRADLTPIEQQLEDLTRGLALVGRDAQARDAEAAPWSSMGEFVRALAEGDADANDYHARNFHVRAGEDSGTTDDVAIDTAGTGFLGTYVKFVQERRRVINLFQTGALPAKGMSVSYAKLVSESLEVAEQVNQFDNLAGPGELKFDDATEPVKTAGGWTQVSRQVIERADVPYLDTVWTALGLKYAKWGEDYVRARLLAEVNKHVVAGGDNVIAMPDNTPDAYDWFDAIVDAGDIYEDRGFNLTGLLVSPDLFKQLYRLEGADGRPLLTVYGTGSNVVGEVNLLDRDGNIGRVPVNILRKTTGRAFFYDPVALKTLESGGAPFRLQDDNIINLSKAFSLYGYMSIIAPFPGALVPVTIPAG